MGLWRIITTPFRRSPRRPLADRRPNRDNMGQNRTVPLGMEGLDLDVIDKAARANDTAERLPTVMGRDGFFARSSTHVAPMPEDETYAARYHRAFQKKGK
ncbi:hypothetical protein [uncultured Tateyamaria sp.]|uniref:hypothetical protein n=1 Tax=uncultured Tateyamaria sp. TaxID=455651 RepID=UPI0026389087|nr:hypothetical protein [uncultured Tateyamaria sp.]